MLLLKKDDFMSRFGRMIALCALGVILFGCDHTNRTTTHASEAEVSPCSSFDNPAYSDARIPRGLRDSTFSTKLLCQLSVWDALPSWTQELGDARNNWADQLHKNAQSEDWPSDLKSIAVEMAEPSNAFLGSNIRSAEKRKIEISHLAPVYLQELMTILRHPFVMPNSSDPDAKMLIDLGQMPEAGSRLARLVGVLEETSYFEGQDLSWNPLLIFASRFIYYHELAHSMNFLSNSFTVHFNLEEAELEFAEEMRADYIALLLFLSELRNNPQLLHAAFSGISLAMSFVGVKEFSRPYTANSRSIKGAVFRVARLNYWIRQYEDIGDVPQGTAASSLVFWNAFKQMLTYVKEIPSPVYDLLTGSAKKDRSDWDRTRNIIVRWITFGDRESVLAGVKSVYEWASVRSITDRRALGVTEIIEYILAQTKDLEPELGLRDTLASVVK